jgi:hypothetical protein
LSEKYNSPAFTVGYFVASFRQQNLINMQKAPLSILLILALTGFTNVYAQETSKAINQPLADSLAELVKVDQIAANIPSGKYKELKPEDWQHYKDSVFGTHQVILEGIFNHYGYPGYSLVGKEGSQHFWLMVQHCDKKPAFQEKILAAMKSEVEKKNADPKNYAYLVDRVMLNTGRKQVYGTQVTYNIDSCQALPRPLQDSATVNVRRKEMGLEPVEVYLNNMADMHFEMNKAMYAQKGITKPKKYIIK